MTIGYDDCQLAKKEKVVYPSGIILMSQSNWSIFGSQIRPDHLKKKKKKGPSKFPYHMDFNNNVP